MKAQEIANLIMESLEQVEIGHNGSNLAENHVIIELNTGYEIYVGLFDYEISYVETDLHEFDDVSELIIHLIG